MTSVVLVQKSKLPEIQRAVKLAEKRIVPPEHQKHVKGFGETIFPATGPREPWYQGTPIEDLSNYLSVLNLPRSLKFADLGAGVGSACFAAAAHFERVIGFEQNADFMAEAEAISREFGIKNIEFRSEDFMRHPLNEFDIIYFFRPFAQDFFARILEKLMTVPSGTRMISRNYMKRELFNPYAFDYLDPRDRQSLLTYGLPDFPPADFYTFVRK